MGEGISNIVPKEKAVLVVVLAVEKDKELDFEKYASELVELAKTSNVDVVGKFFVSLRKVVAGTYIGAGKLEELKQLVLDKQADVVIFNVNLKPTQQRNIEDILEIKTIDYTQLILDIFAKNAKSLEGKMQVELAQLEYLLPRLSGKGIFLSRLGGGIGTRGPGETKLETDRRRIAKRIMKLKGQLERYRKHRERIRLSRRRSDIIQISLAGYTSAGKSTLLNALTSAGQIVSSSLFTTLDTLSRRIKLSDGRMAVISDTVGFIDGLPHQLVEAFKGTLEEVVLSDLVLVVVDVADDDWRRKTDAVFEVLSEIGCSLDKIMIVGNKVDISDPLRLRVIESVFSDVVFVSAKEKTGIKELIDKITEKLVPMFPYREELIPYTEIKRLSKIREYGRILEEVYREDGILVKGYWKED